LDATGCHWAEGVLSDSANGWVSVPHAGHSQPFRVSFSELEFGAFQDIGYTVSYFIYLPLVVK